MGSSGDDEEEKCECGIRVRVLRKEEEENGLEKERKREDAIFFGGGGILEVECI